MRNLSCQMKALAIVAIVFITFQMKAQTEGCTDPLATNFNSTAYYNDGSCSYDAVSVTPEQSAAIDASLDETSGLVLWNGYLWTHNDDNDINLYALDTVTGNILQTVAITGAVNTDWEELAQDETHLYVGDFGNNANGNRNDLHILKIPKNSIVAGSPTFETIAFSYSDQTNLNPTGANNTDFDCEAMIVTTDSIFLFTKQWISKKTTRYALPKTPGTHSALPRETLNVNGLVTGATYNEEAGLTVLIGYSTFGNPFLTLLYDQPGYHFFDGCVRNITLNIFLHQTEGIATSVGLKFYITNEKLVQPPNVNIAQQFHRVDLTSFTGTTVNPPIATWTGTTGNDWFAAANWNPATLPQSYQRVVVPAAANPLIINHPTNQSAICRDLFLEPTGQLIISTNDALLVRRKVVIGE